MKILIIGNGGREHAMAWKAAQNKEVTKIYCAPGNGGTAIEDKCENIDIQGIESLIAFCKKEDIYLTIVGPEVPLVEGLVDEFKKEGLRVFGPSQKAARLEGSKSFSKDFMKKYKIKTAAYMVFDQIEDAILYLDKCSYPTVIKADGLAAGKGVAICQDKKEALIILKDFMEEDIFKGSGKKVVIEEFLEGVEASILSITDGKTILPFISAKDHKTIFENNQGPNTGGMGTVAPNPYCSPEVLKDFNEHILKPTLEGIIGEDMDYVGIIFFGVMITKKGCYLLEYNVRMGDPETQVVLPLMKSDFIDFINAAVDGRLMGEKLEFYPRACACVVAASGGYPGKYKTGLPISFSEKLDMVFVAGAITDGSGKLLTSGGRVLSVVEMGANIKEASEKAYESMKKVSFKDMYVRKDIGK